MSATAFSGPLVFTQQNWAEWTNKQTKSISPTHFKRMLTQSKTGKIHLQGVVKRRWAGLDKGKKTKEKIHNWVIIDCMLLSDYHLLWGKEQELKDFRGRGAPPLLTGFKGEVFSMHLEPPVAVYSGALSSPACHLCLTRHWWQVSKALLFLSQTPRVQSNHGFSHSAPPLSFLPLLHFSSHKVIQPP